MISFDKIKVVFFIIGSLLTVVTLKSEGQNYLGLDAGILRNTLLVSNFESEHFETYAQDGVTIGTFVSKVISPHSSFIFELRFSQKNYEKVSLTSHEINEKITNNYIDLPVGFRVSLLKRRNWITFADFGGYFAYWLSSSRQSHLPDLFSTVSDGTGQYSTSLVFIKSSYYFDPDKDNRCEAGINIGIGEMFDFKKKQIGFKFNFMRSFSDQARANSFAPISRTNQSFKLTVVYAIQIGHL